MAFQTVVLLSLLQAAGGMSADQVSAFNQAGGGSAASASSYGLLFGGLLATIALIWVVWCLIDAYGGWAQGQLKIEDLGGLAVGLIFLLTILLYFVRP